MNEGWEPQKVACPRCKAQFEGAPNFCPECGLSKEQAAGLQGPAVQPDTPRAVPTERFAVRDRSAPPTNPNWEAERKKLTPWWRHPVMIVMYVVFGVIVLGSLAGDADEPRVGRAARRAAQTASVGGGVTVGGLYAEVDEAVHKERINSIFEDGYLVANVTVMNRGDSAESFSPFDWALQTPYGELVSPSLTGESGELESGALIPGGVTGGDVIFEVGLFAKGTYTILYKPDSSDETGVARWRVQVASRRSQTTR